jgi:sugar phosphate isomerase/epimerase
LWVGFLTIKALPLSERIRVTAEAGFDALTITPVDYARAIDRGLGGKDISLVAKDDGFRITRLDPLTHVSCNPA